MSTNPTHEVHALRYARSSGRRSEKYHRYGALGLPDGPIDMDFYFWLVRGDGRTILVDCGFAADQTDFPGYAQETNPVDLLARMGVRPEDVDHVVLTHMHFDHVGNVGLFPHATFSMARAEYEFWTGEHAGKPHLGIGGLPHEIAAVTALRDEGRLTLVEEDGREVVPGLRVRPVRGHTPGQLISEIETASGLVVLASDAAHFYEEMESDLPFWLFADLEGMYRTYALLRGLAGRPDTVVVPGHDPAVMDRFAHVAPECVDLAQAVDQA